MRKKCVICGIDIDESVAVCPKCGTQKPTEPPEFQTISNLPASPKKKVNVRAFILGGMAVVLVVSVVLLLHLVFGMFKTTPDSPIVPPTLLDNHMAFRNGDVEKLELLAPDEYWEYFAQKQNMDKDWYLRSQKSIYYISDEIHPENRDRQEAGQILSAANMTAEALQELSQVLFHIYGIPESSVTAGAEVTIQWTITTPDKSWDVNPEALLAVEIHGSWYLVKYLDHYDEATVAFYK